MFIDVPEVKQCDPKITWESFLKRSKPNNFEAEKERYALAVCQYL